jgi:hypothetical protein
MSDRCEVCDYSTARYLVNGMQVCTAHLGWTVDQVLLKTEVSSIARFRAVSG